MHETRARAAAGSRYSSTKRTATPPTTTWRSCRPSVDLRVRDGTKLVVVGLSHHPQACHRQFRLRLVDLRHGKADVDQHPIARSHADVLEQPVVDVPAHSGNVDFGQLTYRVDDLDHLTGDPEAHRPLLSPR